MGEIQATPEGTRQYFQRIAVPSPKQKNFDGLSVASLGAGTYLGPADDATDGSYHKILVAAGLSGVNFFDTAIHYRCQRSERTLGKALQELEARGEPRESLVIATKGGTIPYEDSPEQFDDYIRIHFLDPGIMKAKEIAAGSHCMSPSFLANQIDASRKNLQLECIDLYYLHNPEIELAEVGEEEFYCRLRAAFGLLEEKVKEKKIARYGMATWNGFRQKKGALQLAKVLQCAGEVGGEFHHFKAIQLPFNLVMLEAIHIKNQIIGKEKKSIAEACVENRIALMVSSPFMQASVGSLCSKVFEKLPTGASRMNQALQFVLSAPQICTAFAGMKEIAHWEENRTALFNAPWSLPDWNAACLSLGIK